jgi:hypothetical protein
MAQGNRYRPYDAPYEQEADYTSYEDRYAEPVDLDSFSSQLRSHHPSRSVVTREEFLPEDSVPLFLAGEDEELQSSKFARPRKRGSRLLKTGAFAIAALIATFVAVKNPFTVFANATASLMGTAEVRQAAAPPAAPPRQAAASAVASTPAMVAGPALATAAAPLPSRDEIALALKTAHQNLAPAEVQQPTTTVATATPAATVPVAAVPAAPAPAPAVAAPIRRIGADELANLMSRGKALLESGDIAPARLLLERAAEAGEASAALLVAQTYDPNVLGALDARNITADPAQARSWYQRAAQLGSADAQRRLSQLQ